MLPSMIKYRFWISGVIILVLGLWFFGAMFKMVGFTKAETSKKSLYDQANQHSMDGLYKNAIDLYEKILILNPDAKEAVLNLAIIYDDNTNNDSRAVELYKRYLELEPESEKRELIENWIIEAARESLGMQSENSSKYEPGIEKYKNEIKTLSAENVELKNEIESLSSKLFNIQSEHQKDIQKIQKQKERLSSLVTESRMRISDLSRALRNAGRRKLHLNYKLEKTD